MQHEKCKEKPWRAQRLVDEAQSEAHRLDLGPLLSRIEAEWVGSSIASLDAKSASSGAEANALGITIVSLIKTMKCAFPRNHARGRLS
jgi:hypothetical protein